MISFVIDGIGNPQNFLHRFHIMHQKFFLKKLCKAADGFVDIECKPAGFFENMRFRYFFFNERSGFVTIHNCHFPYGCQTDAMPGGWAYQLMKPNTGRLFRITVKKYKKTNSHRSPSILEKVC